jgi:hypothetical protein
VTVVPTGKSADESRSSGTICAAALSTRYGRDVGKHDTGQRATITAR